MLFALFMSAFLLIKRCTLPQISILHRSSSLAAQTTKPSGTLVIGLNGFLSFANIQQFQNAIAKLIQIESETDPSFLTLVIDAENVHSLDMQAAQGLAYLLFQLHKSGKELFITHLHSDFQKKIFVCATHSSFFDHSVSIERMFSNVPIGSTGSQSA